MKERVILLRLVAIILLIITIVLVVYDSKDYIMSNEQYFNWRFNSHLNPYDLILPTVVLTSIVEVLAFNSFTGFCTSILPGLYIFIKNTYAYGCIWN